MNNMGGALGGNATSAGGSSAGVRKTLSLNFNPDNTLQLWSLY